MTAHEPFICFNRGRGQFCVNEREVAAVVDWQTPALLPHAPETVMGVVGVHGRMLTVLDLSKFGSESSEAGAMNIPRKIIALRGDEQLALAADNLIDANDGIDMTVIEVKDLFANAIEGYERRRRRF